MMLEKIGYQVKLTASADKAIQAIEEFKPDVILMDIVFKNGNMDGLAAAHLIRETQNTPIIFTSGNSPIATKNKIKSIDHSSSLTKPIDFKLLKQKLAELL